MTTENLTTYTETDPNSRITVDQDRVTFASLTNSEDAYVYKDKGVDYFSADFSHDFTFNISAATTNQPLLFPWALTNAVDDLKGIKVALGSFLGCYIIYATGSILRIVLSECDGGDQDDAVINIGLSTTYYARVWRNEAVGTYGTIYLALYTDAARTAQYGSTVSVTLRTSKKDFRYIFALGTWNSGDGDTVSGYAEDFELTNAAVPTITTQAVTSISGTTSTGNGNITNLGYPNPTQHGHCWNTAGTPTTADSKTQNGAASATGAFTSAMTGLVAGTKYYVRAYATNAVGTSYGNEVVFIADEGMVFEPSALVQMAFGQSSIMDASPTWTDISDDVRKFRIKRGRMHDLDRVEAGTAILVLNNLAGNWWRYNTAGAYTPNVKPITLVRISGIWSGTTYRRFYGVVESFKHDWLSERGGKVPIVIVSCVDLFKSFNRLKLQALPGLVDGSQEVVAIASDANSLQADVVIKSLADSATEGCDIELLHAGQTVTLGDNTPQSEILTISGINKNTYTLTMTTNLANSYVASGINPGYIKKFPARLSGTRINDVLAELGWPAALADIDAGQVTMAELVPGAGGVSALEHMLDVAESEGGVLFISGTGKVVFQDRDARLTTGNGITCDGSTTIDLNTAQATFSDDGANQKYTLAGMEDDDAFIYNEARISGTVPIDSDGNTLGEQIYRDLTKQAAQGARVLSRTGSQINASADAFDQAYQIVERYKDSVLRCPSMLVLPDADPTNLFPKVLLYDLSTRINLEMNASPNVAMLDQDYHIEGIEDNYTAGELWETKWQLWDVNLFRIIQAAHTGVLQKVSTVSYAAAQGAASADAVTDDGDVFRTGQSNEFDPSNDWYVYRGFLQFDTSAIGASATIESAELILEVFEYRLIDAGFDLTLVSGSTITNPLELSDFGILLNQTTSYGALTIATPAINRKVIVITLNATGIAAINKTGTTVFGLRSSRDISVTTPGSGSAFLEWFGMGGKGSGSTFVPRLIVKLHKGIV